MSDALRYHIMTAMIALSDSLFQPHYNLMGPPSHILSYGPKYHYIGMTVIEMPRE